VGNPAARTTRSRTHLLGKKKCNLVRSTLRRQLLSTLNGSPTSLMFLLLFLVGADASAASQDVWKLTWPIEMTVKYDTSTRMYADAHKSLERGTKFRIIEEDLTPYRYGQNEHKYVVHLSDEDSYATFFIPQTPDWLNADWKVKADGLRVVGGDVLSIGDIAGNGTDETMQEDVESHVPNLVGREISYKKSGTTFFGTIISQDDSPYPYQIRFRNETPTFWTKLIFYPNENDGTMTWKAESGRQDQFTLYGRRRLKENKVIPAEDRLLREMIRKFRR
jgi:hypothetical protein